MPLKPGCTFEAWLQVPDVPGAAGRVMYSGTLQDKLVGARPFAGPPFADDGYTTPGVHRWALSASSSSGDCHKDAELEATRWTRRRFFVTVDEASRLYGFVTTRQGAPVRGARVTISGPTSTGVTTGAGGAYRVKVKPGRYRISAGRYCVVGLGGCAHAITKHVGAGGARVDFQTGKDLMLTGRVTRVACTATACADPAPQAGVTVSATGGGETTQVSTLADGSYALALQPGRYVVSPVGPGGYAPASRTVDLQGDVQRANFTDCTLDGAPGCAPDAVDFAMPERLTPQARLARTLPRDSFVNPSSWTVDLFARRNGLPAPCPEGLDLEWTVHAPKGAKVLEQPGDGCSPTMKVSRLGHYRVSVRVAGDDDAAQRPKGGADVDVRDLLVVGLGDSAASGEGNPDLGLFPALFSDQQCDRSTLSNQYLAAKYVEDQDVHTSVTFLFAACSGAITTDLFSTHYRGVRPGAALPPQIDDVAFGMRERDGQPARKADAAIMSIGVNDIGFGPFLQYCIERFAFGFADCTRDHVEVVRDARQAVAAFKLDKTGRQPTLAAKITALIQELPKRYRPLQAALGRPLSASGKGPGGLGLAAGRVMITPYPNFTTNEFGQRCGPTTNPGFSLATATWDFIDRSTSLLDQRVGQSGFRVVPVDSRLFDGHGYCAGAASLFVGVTYASATGDPAGPFHPNAEAHRDIAQAIEPQLCRTLYGTPDCSGRPKG